MMSALKDYEITQDESQADAVVINSCTVTNGADSHVRSYLSHVEKTMDAKVFLTGCGAHTKERAFLNQDEFTVCLDKVRN